MKKIMFPSVVGGATALLLAAVMLTGVDGGNVAARAQTATLSVASTAPTAGIVRKVARTIRSQTGKGLVIQDVVIGVNRLTIHYKATGISPIDFSNINADPTLAAQGPTLLRVAVDGRMLRTIEGTTSGETQSSTILGEEVLQWSGGVPHHFSVVVARIMGDRQAAFATDFDLK